MLFDSNRCSYLFFYVGAGCVRGGVRAADMVHRQGRPALHRRLPARADRGRRRHGRRHPRRPALHRRVRRCICKRNTYGGGPNRHYISLIDAYIYYGCRIIGAVLIVIGLYFVLWGKSEEKKTREQDPEMTRHLLGQDGPAAKDQEVNTDLLA